MVGLFFLIAFVVDQATAQRYSNVLGSGAIAASALALWPWQRSLIWNAGGYIGTWLGFALLRAGATNVSVPVISPESAGNLEEALFGGRVPSATLQDAFYSSGAVQVHDLAFMAVHASFFLVPTCIAVVLLLFKRQQFVRYWIATGIMLLLGAVGFFLAPTAPPWMQSEDVVHRVIVDQANGRGLSFGSASFVSENGTQQLAFDPNSLAAMPSIHVAAAVLVCFACWPNRRTIRLLGIAYALAMSVSVVYLGEHYVLDVLGGWMVASMGWWLASRYLSKPASPEPNRPRNSSIRQDLV